MPAASCMLSASVTFTSYAFVSTADHGPYVESLAQVVAVDHAPLGCTLYWMVCTRSELLPTALNEYDGVALK